MRATLSLLLFFLSSISLYAEETDIEIKKEIILGRDWHSPEKRLNVSHDNNILFISSDDIIEIRIRIKDIDTDFDVYDDTLSLSGGERRSLYTKLKNGIYKIELILGDTSYVGHFVIDELDS